ncbi:DinB family protein [Anoxybacillus sp. ST4]|uniref:DinB family protein n=1 Tax=Anoxybacillus sp. ST4 TaxID=2864181 RepID=UPI001C643548|nr:DinB family protein [Anoxybacillus sp. ST4]MBW7651703.1 DinB family protein [Anoxybacillus sp. ST4]
MDYNEKVRQQLIQSVSSLSDEQLNTRVTEGNWTIAQVLEHLYLIETSIATMIAHTLTYGVSEPVEKKPIHLTIDRSKKVEAPDFARPSDRFFSRHELEEKLDQSRQRLRKVAEQANEADLETKSFSHPVFGPLNLKQWVEFVGYHEQRHLLQIEEIKAHLS